MQVTKDGAVLRIDLYAVGYRVPFSYECGNPANAAAWHYILQRGQEAEAQQRAETLGRMQREIDRLTHANAGLRGYINRMKRKSNP